MEQGRLDNAEQMNTWTLARCIEKQGFNCQTIMNVIADLRILYQRQKKLLRAQYMSDQALRWYKQHLGLLDSCTLGHANLLANVYADQGKQHETEYQYRKVLRAHEVKLGPSHKHTNHTVHILALVLAE
jgi:hypothetical protein